MGAITGFLSASICRMRYAYTTSMSARWPSTSRMHHLSGAGLYRRVLSVNPDTAAAICLGLFSAASRCCFSSASFMMFSLDFDFLHPLHDLHVPAQLLLHGIAQL